MPRVKFKEAGRWADQPHLPQITVEAGEEHDLSPALADVVVRAGKGTYVTAKRDSAPSKKVRNKREANPAHEDKARGEGAPGTEG